VLVRSAPIGVFTKICKSSSVVEIFFSPLHYGKRESLRATPLNIANVTIFRRVALKSVYSFVGENEYFVSTTQY
jgi:hypothetical protein